ncbi:MAG: hypothetical protein K0U67_07225, partial [Actinomycetia bacterium]|nr:hypothetical protein [Actinomycetes bacterium]
VLSQNQTLQTKTPHRSKAESESEKSDQATRKHLAKQKTSHPDPGEPKHNKKQTTNKNHQTHY